MKCTLFLFFLLTGFTQESLPQNSFADLSKPIAVPEFSYKPKKDPEMATLLSSFFPGLGHFYLEDSKTAGALMGAGTMELGSFFAALAEKRKDVAFFSIISFANTLNYGVYAAYRDARACNPQELYHYKTPMDSLPDLTAAPFRWSVLRKPEVWGGCLGALAIACCVGYFAFPSEARIHPPSVVGPDRIEPWFPLLALPVGIGEEAIFRGVVQPRFAESLGPWGAVAASSVVFGAAHIPNGFAMEKEERRRYYTFSIPLITGIGAYLGWLAQKNGSLKESVAVHTWYDFTLFAMSALAQSAAIGLPNFSYSVPF